MHALEWLNSTTESVWLFLWQCVELFLKTVSVLRKQNTGIVACTEVALEEFFESPFKEVVVENYINLKGQDNHCERQRRFLKFFENIFIFIEFTKRN